MYLTRDSHRLRRIAVRRNDRAGNADLSGQTLMAVEAPYSRDVCMKPSSCASAEFAGKCTRRDESSGAPSAQIACCYASSSALAMTDAECGF